MRHWGRFGIAVLLLSAAGSGAASAADSLEPAAGLLPELRLSSEVPGEVSLRLPLPADSPLLRGLVSPYLSLGSSAALEAPSTPTLASGVRRDPDGLEDVRVGAGMTVPISERLQLYGEYRFLHGRIDGGRGLFQREPEAADFRAGFSIRLY